MFKHPLPTVSANCRTQKMILCTERSSVDSYRSEQWERSERHHFKLHFKHDMIPIDTYAALVSFCRTGRHPEHHILQLRRNTKQVPREEKIKGKGGFEVSYPGQNTDFILQ